MNHLDYTRTEIALVNSNSRQGIDDKRLRWVPHASVLLYPLPADHLMARSPSHKADIAEAREELQGFLTEAGSSGVPADLPGYIRFIDDTLRRWPKQGAVAVKFSRACPAGRTCTTCCSLERPVTRCTWPWPDWSGTA
jgi:hypothetical protein